MTELADILEQFEEWVEFNNNKYESQLSEKEHTFSWLQLQNSFLQRMNTDLNHKIVKLRDIIYSKQAEVNQLVTELDK